eukprot:1924850-Rhodomonas_salina.4
MAYATRCPSSRSSRRGHVVHETWSRAALALGLAIGWHGRWRDSDSEEGGGLKRLGREETA